MNRCLTVRKLVRTWIKKMGRLPGHDRTLDWTYMMACLTVPRLVYI